MIVIPAIDLRDGRCVRLLQGNFADETHYSDDPVELARQYRNSGFEQLHVVDLDGALTGTQVNRELVARIVGASDLIVQLGGGIRSREGVSHWLDAGVSRCVIGSLAVTAPELVAGWLLEFGADRIVLALDVRLDTSSSGRDAAKSDLGLPVLSTHGWTRSADLTLWQCLDIYRRHGLRHVLCTDISRDGAMSGPNDDLYGEFMRRYPELELQASGGIRHAGDLEALRAQGCTAAVTGRALLDGRISAPAVAAFLRGA